MAQAAALEGSPLPGLRDPAGAGPSSTSSSRQAANDSPVAVNPRGRVRLRIRTPAAAAAAAAAAPAAAPAPAARRGSNPGIPQRECIDLLDSDTESEGVQVVAVRPGTAAAAATTSTAATTHARKRGRPAGASPVMSPKAALAAAGVAAAAGQPTWAQPAAPPRREPSPEPAYKCAICLEAITDMATTPCGHVFCYSCLKDAIKVHKKCPKCRKGVQMKQIHKIYLN